VGSKLIEELSVYCPFPSETLCVCAALILSEMNVLEYRYLSTWI
jgi:hypothetical protein